MSRLGRGLHGAMGGVLLCVAGWNGAFHPAAATEILLKDDRILRGKLVPVDSLADQPKAPEAVGVIRRIVLIDDGLRRTFVPERQVRQRLADEGQLQEKFSVHQQILRSGRKVRGVGSRIPRPPLDKFDEFGRRIFTFGTLRGPVNVIQGITLITPQWTKVEGLNYIWDMRIATSSIPRDILDKILLKQLDPKNIEHRKKIARFYLQSDPEGLPRQAGRREAVGADDSVTQADGGSEGAKRVESPARGGPTRPGVEDAQGVSLGGRCRRDPPGGPRDDPGVREAARASTRGS